MKKTPGGNILAHVIEDLIEVKQDNQATINLNQIVNYVQNYKVESKEHKTEVRTQSRVAQGEKGIQFLASLPSMLIFRKTLNHYSKTNSQINDKRKIN